MPNPDKVFRQMAKDIDADPLRYMGMPRDDSAKAWKQALHDSLPKTRGLPLFLSGGLDSGTILAALIERGESPHCYSFRVGTEDSKDVEISRLMCSQFNLDHTVIDLPRDTKWLEADVYETIQLIKSDRKAGVQCCQPFKHLVDAVLRDGHTEVFVGTGAIVNDTKRVAIVCAKEGEEAARKLREQALDDKYNETGTGLMHRLAQTRGLTLHEPYSEEPLRSHGLSLNMSEINNPRQKGIAVRAFPAFWDRDNYYRRNSPLQVNSGVREWHDDLLQTARGEGCTIVRQVYTKMLREIQGD